MLDKTIPYYDVLMSREKGVSLNIHYLPESYKFVLFKSGDEKEWAKIETSVGEFDSVEKALDYFKETYLANLKELERRCFFIENKDGLKVATLTIWWNYTSSIRNPWIHWFAVLPEYQGVGLGKAIVYEAMKRLIEVEGDVNVFLHTQTWSYKAIGIYQKQGFKITDKKGLGGYENTNYQKAKNLLKIYLR